MINPVELHARCIIIILFKYYKRKKTIQGKDGVSSLRKVKLSTIKSTRTSSQFRHL